jgi:hypothetical protein
MMMINMYAFSFSDIYSVRYFYGIVNHGGIIHIHTPVCGSLMPPGKLARYTNSGKGSSSSAFGHALAPPVADSNSKEEEEEVPVRRVLHSGYVLNDEEEATAIQQVSVISEAETREAEAVRAVRTYEAT